MFSIRYRILQGHDKFPSAFLGGKSSPKTLVETYLEGCGIEGDARGNVRTILRSPAAKILIQVPCRRTVALPYIRQPLRDNV